MAKAQTAGARVLVTRPTADAETLNAALLARGFVPLSAPLLTIVNLPAADLDLDGVQALLFTSANGVRAFAAACSDRGLPAFAVGDATAGAARAAGFDDVCSAGGDVADLARLVTVRLRPEAGALLHAAASKLAGDLQAVMQAAGFALRRAILYEARPLDALPTEICAELSASAPEFAVFFSPRTAETFVRLIRQAGLQGSLVACRAICLSQAVAESLRTLDWAGIEVAAVPTQKSLLKALETVAG